jgi:hypothetical protein
MATIPCFLSFARGVAVAERLPAGLWSYASSFVANDVAHDRSGD